MTLVGKICRRQTPILHFVENIIVFKLLQQSGAQCSTYSQNLRKIIDTLNLIEEDIYKFPLKLLNSLSSSKETYIPIPKLVHQIWLTSESNPQEISAENLNNIIRTRDFFSDKMKGTWNIIVWFGNKDLTPKSIEFLASYNIEIRFIDDFSDKIKLFDQIQQSILQGKLVMASDMLRYSIMEFLGGVYADLNYEFLNHFDFEMNKYDFFINSLVNSFFIAKPNHPIIKAEIDFLQKLFNDEFASLLWLKTHLNTRDQTMFTTAYSFEYNIIKHINEESNVDFVSPTKGELVFNGFTCNLGIEAFRYADLMEYCSNPLVITGIDQQSGWEA